MSNTVADPEHCFFRQGQGAWGHGRGSAVWRGSLSHPIPIRESGGSDVSSSCGVRGEAPAAQAQNYSGDLCDFTRILMYFGS